MPGSSTPPLGKEDRLLYEIGILIARARRLVWTAAARELEAKGSSMLAWGLLAYLVGHGPATQREIAEATSQHAAGVSRLLDEMEAQKLVRRRRDATDRRRARVEATAAGRALFRAGQPHVVGALGEAFAPLSTPERRELRGLLEGLCSGPLADGKCAPPRRAKR